MELSFQRQALLELQPLRLADGPTIGELGLVVARGRGDFFDPGDDPASSGEHVHVGSTLQVAGFAPVVASG